MHNKQRFQNLLFRTISPAATAPLAIVLALATIATQSAQAQTCFEPGGNLQIIHDFTDKSAEEATMRPA